MIAWLVGFVGTLVLETPVYALGLRRWLGARRAIAASLLVNGVTHPLAWSLTAGRSWATYAAVEVGVWLVETALLWGWSRRARTGLPLREALVLALVANALSAGAGLLVLPLIAS